MDHLQQELDRLLVELSEMDRCSEQFANDSANYSLMTIAKRGTKLEIAEVRRLLAQRDLVH